MEAFGVAALQADTDSQVVMFKNNLVFYAWNIFDQPYRLNGVDHVVGDDPQDWPATLGVPYDGHIHGVYEGMAKDIVFYRNNIADTTGPLVKFGYYPFTTASESTSTSGPAACTHAGTDAEGTIVHEYPTGVSDRRLFFISNAFGQAAYQYPGTSYQSPGWLSGLIEENSIIRNEAGNYSTPAEGDEFINNAFLTNIPSQIPPDGEAHYPYFFDLQVPPDSCSSSPVTSTYVPEFPGWNFMQNSITGVAADGLVVRRIQATDDDAFSSIYGPRLENRYQLLEQMGAPAFAMTDAQVDAYVSALLGGELRSSDPVRDAQVLKIVTDRGIEGLDLTPGGGGAFQGSNGDLWTMRTLGLAGAQDTNLPMMAGTSPSITALAGGGFDVAFHGSNGDVWTTGCAGTTDWHAGMMAGTSPSIAALAGGGFEVAFQANTGVLWTTGSAGTTDWQLGMMGGTNPSITALAGGGFEVAFQANTTDLWTVDDAGNSQDTQLGMMRGTSPSITALARGGFEVAFQANTGILWTADDAGFGQDTNLGMMAGTSPSITALAGSGFEIAFQGSNGHLWTVNDAGHSQDWQVGMTAGTSPAIVPNGSSFKLWYQGNDGKLHTAGAGTGSAAVGMATGTSPSAG